MSLHRRFSSKEKKVYIFTNLILDFRCSLQKKTHEQTLPTSKSMLRIVVDVSVLSIVRRQRKLFVQEFVDIFL